MRESKAESQTIKLELKVHSLKVGSPFLRPCRNHAQGNKSNYADMVSMVAKKTTNIKRMNGL